MSGREELLRVFIREKRKDRIRLMPILHKADELYGKIDISVRRIIADELEIPVADISAVVTFYSAFNGMDDGCADDRFLAHTERENRIGFITGHPKGYAAIRKVLAEKTDVIGELEKGKALGKSGSGFPMAAKWKLTRDAFGDEKYIICNGSEGEGNTFKDYHLFCHYPKTIIEGMILCSLVTGIPKGYVYVRAEYPRAFESMEKAVKEARSEGALGENIFGTEHSFDLEVILGGGAYVSGEETGLLQALEGNRSEPRLKPPFPGISGLFGKPTIIQNAESFAAAAVLLYRGAEAFCREGTESAGGTKLYTICGCVKNPGVYEAPYHTTIRGLLTLAGGAAERKEIRGFQIGGGATGAFGDSTMLDTILDYQSLRNKGLNLGTASVYFFSTEESVPELARKSIAFLKDQSCGMCTACKYGLAELLQKLTELCQGNGTWKTLAEMEELCGYISVSSRCALGQASPTALQTAMRWFRQDFETLCRKEGNPYEYDLSDD